MPNWIHGAHVFIPLAYINPALGSTAFQIAIAALLGGLYAVRLYWNRFSAPWVCRKNMNFWGFC